ncbi:hypothetical protein EP331_13350 [bacterium]|nr:MAG: hypothetical protein EP331_13350 [bacterium]
MKSISFIFLIISFATDVSFACICEKKTIEQEIRESSIIFTGTVLSIERDSTLNEYITFNVADIFKGSTRNTIIIINYYQTCNYVFEKGKTYLVFGNNEYVLSKKTNKLEISNPYITTSICNRTGEIEYRKRELSKLNKLKASGLNIKEINSEKLYNDIWKDEFFLRTDKPSTYPLGDISLKFFLYENFKEFRKKNKLEFSYSNNHNNQKTTASDIDFPLPDSLQRYKRTLSQAEIDSLLKDVENHKLYSTTDLWIRFNVSRSGLASNFQYETIYTLDNGIYIENTAIPEKIISILTTVTYWNPAEINGIPVNSEEILHIDLTELNE